MSKAALTVRAFGYYLLVLGVVLILAPNVLLTMSFMPPTSEVWIRVVGVVVFNLGVYYIYAAKCEATAFFQASVYTRTFVLLAFAAFWLAGLAKPMLVAFGAVDFLGGLWTWRALKSASQPPGQPDPQRHPAPRRPCPSSASRSRDVAGLLPRTLGLAVVRLSPIAFTTPGGTP